MADIAPVLIWMSDGDKRCTYVNKTWLAFTGRTLAAELGDGWRDCIHPDDLPKWLDTLAAAFERREPFKVEYRLARHDNEYRWVLDTGVPQLVLDGSLAGYIGSCVDITDLKHAQAELVNSADRLRLALESGKSLAFEWDLKSGRDTCFGDLQTILGIVDTTFVGRIDDFRQGLHPDDRERVLKAIDEAERHGMQYEEEFRIRWPDGTVRWVAAKGRFSYAADGQATHMLGIATDITERKQAEESLRRKESELTEAQRLAAIGSWQWNRDTDDIVWSKELFRIAGLEPGSATALDVRNHPQLYPPKDWDRIRRCADESLRDGTPYELDVEMFCGNGSPKWVTARAFCSESSVRQKIEVDFSPQGVPSTVPPDIALCLFRVLQEAVRNAVRHSAARRVEVSFLGTPDGLRLTVRDAGRGFDAESVSHAGGLGLTSMRERLKLVAGELSIESKPGRGTTIVARVPLSTPRATSPLAERGFGV